MRDPAVDQFLKKNFSKDEYDKYFKPLRLYYDRSLKLIEVKFPHKFFQRLFFLHIRDKFEKKIHALVDDTTVRYVCDNPQEGGASQFSQIRQLSLPFGANYTFENFLHNHANLYPFTLCKELVESDQDASNHLLLIGPPGVGKKHLLRSMANAMAKEHNSVAVRLLTLSELFSIRRRGFEDPLLNTSLKGFFLHLGHWPIPGLSENDLYYLSSLIQSLMLRKVKIASVLDLLPDAPTFVPPYYLHVRTTSTVQAPDLEIRTLYLKKINRSKRLGLDKDRMLRIALLHSNFLELSSVTADIRSHKELAARMKSAHESPVQHLDTLLQVRSGQATSLSSNDIVNLVAVSFHLTSEDLLGSSRRKNVVQARSVAIFFCREFLGLSLPAIGRIFGGRNHASIVHALKKIQISQENDPNMNQMITHFRQILHQGQLSPSLTSNTPPT